MCDALALTNQTPAAASSETIFCHLRSTSKVFIFLHKYVIIASLSSTGNTV